MTSFPPSVIAAFGDGITCMFRDRPIGKSDLKIVIPFKTKVNLALKNISYYFVFRAGFRSILAPETGSAIE
jgi:hypothetical protein